jgi:hypothetical protein
MFVYNTRFDASREHFYVYFAFTAFILLSIKTEPWWLWFLWVHSGRLSVARMTDELEGIWEETIKAQLSFVLQFLLEWLKKPIKYQFWVPVSRPRFEHNN